MQKTIKFVRFGANSVIGGFAPGDMLSCSEDVARHLVEEADVAEYVARKEPAVEVQPKPTRKAKQ